MFKKAAIDGSRKGREEDAKNAKRLFATIQLCAFCAKFLRSLRELYFFAHPQQC